MPIHNLSKMKSVLEEIKVLMTGHHHIDDNDINKLHSPRREQLLFLEKLVQLIETKSKRPQTLHAELANLMNVCNGALALLEKDTPANSHLHQLVSRALADQGKPSQAQLASYFKSLHGFLYPLLFQQQEGCAHFKEQHPFAAEIPPAMLIKFMNIIYHSICTHDKAWITGLSNDGSSGFALSKYKEPNADQDLINHFFKPWHHFKEAVNHVRREELTQKNVTHIDQLPKIRCKQLTFLSLLEQYLSDIPMVPPQVNTMFDSEKVAILAGAMLVIEQQINQEYTRHSLVQTEIAKHLSKTSLPTSFALICVQAFDQMFRAMVIEGQDDNAKIRVTYPLHPANADHCLDARALLHTSQDMIASYNQTLLAEAAPKVETAKNSVKHAAHTLHAFASSLFGKTKGSEANVTETSSPYHP